MTQNYLKIVVYLNIFSYALCGYTPTGDEIQVGSVLLPASRRGRYLANIVRRQAVDGTGIKFNKDADRMNAESKKKVDVLSEELLPYIIAEQERRTTLHKRVMTAIQNGEKGVTIAEIRNKPPVFIRKGIMYRCPMNRAPIEPDGSGIIMCETEILPLQITYESCLSAEDRDLYVTDNNRYFFCNRHRTEGPDLPYNGSTIIGCAPAERTSLNYTRAKCVLEDTDDVVVHYRYYPDKSYKYVTELDPDREVCDHWNPCQIGYIYSIPSMDQAKLANDLWHDMQPDIEYQNDEIVEPVPEDSEDEGVHPSAKNYTTSMRRVPIPEGGELLGIRVQDAAGNFKKIKRKHVIQKIIKGKNNTRRCLTCGGPVVLITMIFDVWKSMFYGKYYCVFKLNNGKEKLVKFLNIIQSEIFVLPKSIDNVHGQNADNNPEIPFMCTRCIMRGIMVRCTDSNIYNLDNSRSRIVEVEKPSGQQQQLIQLDLKNLQPQEYGDYFAIIQNGDGVQERVKIATVIAPEKDSENQIPLKRLSSAVGVGSHFDKTINFECSQCDASDVLCNGQSVLAAGRVSLIGVSKMVSFNFPRFEDEHSCVYLGFFKLKEKVLKKILAIFENNSVTVEMSPPIAPPEENQPFEHDITYSCTECSVETLRVNGLKIPSANSRRSLGADSNVISGGAFYDVTSTQILLRIPEYKPIFEGVYQAVFNVGSDSITKNVLEIGLPEDISNSAEHTETSSVAANGPESSSDGAGEAESSSKTPKTDNETPAVSTDAPAPDAEGTVTDTPAES